MLVRFPGARSGIIPWPNMPIGMTNPPAFTSGSALVASNTGFAIPGSFIHDAGVGITKKIMKIHTLPGTITHANAATNVRFGLQGIATGNTGVRRPDGTFLSSGNAYYDSNTGTTVMSSDTLFATGNINGGSGTDVVVGAPLAFVAAVTAYGGSDSIILKGIGVSGATTYDRLHGGFLNRSTNVSGNVWASALQALGSVFLECDDGTYGTISGSFPTANTLTSTAFNNGTASTEYGVIVLLPFPYTIYGFGAIVALAAGATGTFTVYTSPLTGTPAATPATFDIDVARCRVVGTAGPYEEWFSSSVDVPANTPVCLALKATSANNLTIQNTTVGAVAQLDALAGRNFRMVSRAGTAVFADTNSGLDYPFMWLRIGRVHDGRGGGRADYHLGI